MGFLIPSIKARLKYINAHVERLLKDSGITVTPQFKAKAMLLNVSVHLLSVLPENSQHKSQVEAANLIAKHVGFQIRVLGGGESKYRQIKEWQGRKDIVVCTPGRVLNLLEPEPQFVAGGRDAAYPSAYS